MDNKISICVWDYGMGTDRYVGEGYKDFMPFEDRVRAIGKLSGTNTIEVCYPNDINEDNWAEKKIALEEAGLTVICLTVELVCDKEWKDGSLSAMDPARRSKSIDRVQKAMDFAESIGVEVLGLWLGQDGFDYVFQNDYAKAYNYLVDSLIQCADHNPKVKLALEYKVSEPKMSCMLRNAGMALAVAQKTDRDNVGVLLDVGHAFNAGENPAEIAAILMSENRLFHLHLNDNYRIADDDMPVGSVHWPQYFEFFYWIDKLGYKGYYSLDMYPYRDDPDMACASSISFINGAQKFVREKLPKDFVTGTEKAPGKILDELFKRFFA